MKTALLLLLCALASCEGYTGGITIGYTGKTPSGQDYTIGVSVPLVVPAKKAPAPAPAAPSGKEVASVLP